MATKYYGIKDNWTNDDLANVIEVASEDGTVSSVKVNGEEYGGGGGGGATELLHTESYTIDASDTSTTAAQIGTITISDFVPADDAYLFITIRNNDGPQNATFYGSDFLTIVSKSYATTLNTMYFKYDAYGMLTGIGNSTPAGIYVNDVTYNDNTSVMTIKIYKKYSAVNTPNWAGTYTCKVMMLTPGPGVEVPLDEVPPQDE